MVINQKTHTAKHIFDFLRLWIGEPFDELSNAFPIGQSFEQSAQRHC